MTLDCTDVATEDIDILYMGIFFTAVLCSLAYRINCSSTKTYMDFTQNSPTILKRYAKNFCSSRITMFTKKLLIKSEISDIKQYFPRTNLDKLSVLVLTQDPSQKKHTLCSVDYTDDWRYAYKWLAKEKCTINAGTCAGGMDECD